MKYSHPRATMRAMNTPNETLQVAPTLHIALVTETYVPEVNGVAITIGRMVHGLLKRGRDLQGFVRCIHGAHGAMRV